MADGRKHYNLRNQKQLTPEIDDEVKKNFKSTRRGWNRMERRSTGSTTTTPSNTNFTITSKTDDFNTTNPIQRGSSEPVFTSPLSLSTPKLNVRGTKRKNPETQGENKKRNTMFDPQASSGQNSASFFSSQDATNNSLFSSEVENMETQDILTGINKKCNNFLTLNVLWCDLERFAHS